jgi:hypothetical protein
MMPARCGIDSSGLLSPMAVERILFRGGALDGRLTARREDPDSRFRIDNVETHETSRA